MYKSTSDSVESMAKTIEDLDNAIASQKTLILPALLLNR